MLNAVTGMNLASVYLHSPFWTTNGIYIYVRYDAYISIQSTVVHCVDCEFEQQITNEQTSTKVIIPDIFDNDGMVMKYIYRPKAD